MMRTRLLGPLAFATVVAGPSVSAQQAAVFTYAQAQAVVSNALVLQQQGDFQSAMTMLNDASARCRGASDAARCGNLINFSIGFVYQREANTATASEPLLRRAIASYDLVALTDTTLAPNAVYNRALAYRTLGPHESQEPGYRRAPMIDVARRGLHYAFLGDYYLARGRRVQDAVVAYRLSAEADPDSEVPRQGLLDAYAQYGAISGREFIAQVAEWDASFPELAAHAYAAIVRRERETEPAIAEVALLRLLSHMSDGQGLNDVALSSLPSDWPPVVELATYMAEPAVPSTDSWWRGSAPRARALSQAMLSVAGRRIATAQPAIGEQYLQKSLELVEPGSREALDASRELALLYFGHRDLDPDGSKLERLDHVPRATPEAQQSAQRYHSILGRIYAAREEWRSDVPGHGAIEQIELAIAAAARRETDGVHQPLPELRSLLATGYTATGQIPAALEQYDRAVADYLDVDDLDGATRAGRETTRFGRPSSLIPLVDYRNRLRSAAGDTTATLCSDGTLRTALAGAGDTASAFVARQRFKVLSDCAEVGPVARRAQYADEALTLVADRKVPLAGTVDQIRVEKATRVRERGVRRNLDARIERTRH